VLAGHTTALDGDGDPVGGYSAGTGAGAMFNQPMGLALADGVLIVADSGNHMIRAVSTATGAVAAVAGSGEPGDLDGPALEALFNAPAGVACHEGTLYIADTSNNKIKSMPFDPSLYTGV
jgi:sugar lactone lactonase YvrE